MFSIKIQYIIWSSHVVRCIRRSSTRSKRWKLKNHVYCQINNYDSLQMFSQSMLRNVIFNEDGLVMINKPNGVGVHLPTKPPSTVSKELIRTMGTAPVDYSNFYLSEVLTYLAEALGYHRLSVVKAPERYTSGVAILSARDKVTSRVQECIKLSKARQCTWETYNAVVLGCPQPKQASVKLGLTLDIEPKGSDKQPILIDKYSKGSIERQEVLPTLIKHTTVCHGLLASLVEVCPSRTKWHLLRVYLAHSLSPVLGDNLYGSRVQSVLGVPLSISPFSERAKLPQKLSKELLKSLEIQAREEALIPCHTHLRRVSILDYRGKGNSLIVEAPFPEFFQWTCAQLHLQERSATKISEIMTT